MTMNKVKNEIIEACRLLFSPDIELSLDYLGRLDLSTLKAAYRNKVFEAHPDRAKLLGIQEHVLVERFKSIDEAYKELHSYIMNNQKKIILRHKPQKRPASGRKTRNEETEMYSYTWSRHLPESELLFGQFLFYSRIISMTTLLDAILWQRKQRPSFGELAVNSGLISAKDAETVIKMRRYGEKFGECALRLGFLNSFQFRHIIGKQQSIQQKIGEYFVKEKIINAAELETLLKRNKIHNKVMRNRQAAS